MKMGGLPTINAFWVGPRLGRMGVSCLRSFVRHGHRVVLHAYERPQDLHPEIELADASRIMPANRILRYSVNGSPALGANFFRYELMAVGAGLYIDCDCYCVGPIEDDEYIFGWESDDVIGNAVLKLPAGSEILGDLLDMIRTDGFIPPWMSSRDKFKYHLRQRLMMPKKLESMPWGTTGPTALTYFAKRRDVDKKALSADSFYPIFFAQSHLLFDAGAKLETFVRPRTRIIHLWNEVTRKRGEPPPVGSPLHTILSEA